MNSRIHIVCRITRVIMNGGSVVFASRLKIGTWLVKKGVVKSNTKLVMEMHKLEFTKPSTHDRLYTVIVLIISGSFLFCLVHTTSLFQRLSEGNLT